MDWLTLIEKLRAHGYDGEAKNLAGVKAYVAEHFDKIECEGQAVDLDALHGKAYPPKPSLDVTAEAKSAEVARQAAELADRIVEQVGIKAKPSRTTETDVKVGKDRFEDDPCLGYPKNDAGGFGIYLADVMKATRAIHSGRPAGVPERLSKAQAVLTKDGTGMNITNDAEGGFLVPTEHRNELLRKAHDAGVIYSRARMVPMGSKSVEIPTINETSRVAGSRQGAVRGYWVEEGNTITASQPLFGKVKLTANKLAALGYITSEMSEDSPVSLSIFGDLFAEELAFKADDAAYRGTGAGQPQGILNANATVSVAKETGQAATTILYENVLKMWSRCWARSRGNAVWFVNQDIEPQLHTMSLAVGTGGVPVYMPAGGASGSPYATLFGRPVIANEFSNTLGTVGDIVLADMSQYLWGSRGGMNTASSIHVAFTTDQEAFRVTWRVDGQPWWNSALTPFQGSNTQSPFITLATRS